MRFGTPISDGDPMSLRALCCTAILALGATTACVDQLPVSPITPPKAIAHDMIACDPTTAIIPCDGDSGGGGGGYAPPPGIPLPGLSMTMCLNVTSYPDSDHDGLNDVCELSLAQAFAPRLYQNPNLRIWDLLRLRLPPVHPARVFPGLLQRHGKLPHQLWARR
jgi:hypothetical protein